MGGDGAGDLEAAGEAVHARGRISGRTKTQLHWLPPIWFSDMKFFLLYGLFLARTERNELSYNRIFLIYVVRFLIYGVRFLIFGLFWRVGRRRKALFLPLRDKEEE